MGPTVFTKTVAIKKLGNMAVHSHKPITQLDALTAVRELFHVCYWLARTYAKGVKPADGVVFDQKLLPKSSPLSAQTLGQLQQLAAEVSRKGRQAYRTADGQG